MGNAQGLVFVRVRWKRVVLFLVTSFILAGVVSIRLFVMPSQGMPPQVDAIVMLNGSGNRLDTALALAWHHRARFIVISRGSPGYAHGGNCAPPIPDETIICFDPSPSTTKGEAEYAGRLAVEYGWHSVALVTSTPQDTRARVRFGRCFHGTVYVVTASIPLSSWPYQIAYEWAATIKAVAFQRQC